MAGVTFLKNNITVNITNFWHHQAIFGEIDEYLSGSRDYVFELRV